MSVKRFYWDTPSEYGHAEEHPEGELVWWKDYAKLEAENVRLMSQLERMHKAGDAMALILLDTSKFKNNESALNWYAAKEGKQP